MAAIEITASEPGQCGRCQRGYAAGSRVYTSGFTDLAFCYECTAEYEHRRASSLTRRQGLHSFGQTVDALARVIAQRDSISMRQARHIAAAAINSERKPGDPVVEAYPDAAHAGRGDKESKPQAVTEVERAARRSEPIPTRVKR